MKRFFDLHELEIENWFIVIAPAGGTLKELREDLVKFAERDWRRIRQP